MSLSLFKGQVLGDMLGDGRSRRKSNGGAGTGEGEVPLSMIVLEYSLSVRNSPKLDFNGDRVRRVHSRFELLLQARKRGK